MTKANLKGVLIKLSVGIGKNILEAEQALKIAKSKKHQGKEYNIEIYSGPSLKYKNYLSKKWEDAYLRIEKTLSNFSNAVLDLEILKKDPKTGLLNRFGYYIEKKKLIDNHKYSPKDRFIILFDGDSMHNLNKIYSYSIVDKYLETIGKALLKSIRNSKDRKDKDILKIKDLLNTRKNDATGDEFIIDLNCPKDQLLPITKRYLTNCYEYQKKLSKKLQL
ncbi:MAG: diguanylate cyclase [archaeon]|jgi:GGDEF domain-containing protein